jgi:DNA-binding CsgD family transcriptional regulator
MVFRQVPSHVKSSGLTSLDPALMSGALSALLQLYEATLSQDIDAFEPFALRCLGRLIGFDGAVWGSGVVAPGRIAELSITRASVVDRPATLLGEYIELAPRDPVTAHFLACPDQPIAVDVEDYYRTRSSAVVGEYLHRHRIAHLLLLGCNSADTGTQTHARYWITAYRESAKPFDGPDVVRLQTLLPLWNQARGLCLTRQMERLARANPVEGGVIALCDRSGLIHAAEPGFSDLTALRGGDTIASEALARLRGPVHAAIPVNGIFLRVQDAGSWVLLQATREGVSAALSQREKQVARHYVEGLSYKEIARELGSSPSTVRTQLQNVYRRLGVHSRTELQHALGARGPA